jgi:hypothetical protein
MPPDKCPESDLITLDEKGIQKLRVGALPTVQRR